MNFSSQLMEYPFFLNSIYAIFLGDKRRGSGNRKCMVDLTFLCYNKEYQVKQKDAYLVSEIR